MVSPGQSDFREATVRYELPVEEPRPAEPAWWSSNCKPLAYRSHCAQSAAGLKLGGDIWPNEHVKPRALTLTVFCDRMRRAVQPF